MKFLLSRAKAQAWVESPRVQQIIVSLIFLNALTLGLETSQSIMAEWGSVLLAIDQVILIIFAAEIAIKLYATGWQFFRNGWNVFDFIIVGIALLPASGPLAVLRAFRILRVMRLLSAMPKLRRVIEALMSALPGMGSIVAVLLLVFYISAVLVTKLFGAAFPTLFGSIGASMYTLFQIMTLEGWSDGVVRPVLASYPYAWLFFIPFIVVTSFAVLNLFIGVIVDSLQRLHRAEEEADAATDQRRILDELKAIQNALTEIKEMREGASSPSNKNQA